MKKRRIVEERLLDSLGGVTAEADMIRVKNLVWMISNGFLDIKIALPTIEDTQGIYHEKVGILFESETADSDVVVFSGSMNETKEGLVSNYESIDVYVSWDNSEREKGRVSGHISHFQRMWENKEIGVETYDFPVAVANRLLELYKPDRPVTEPGRKRRPYEFQTEALHSWEKANYHSVLAMATGTGKTFTALKCVEKTPKNVLVIVAVPQDALVEQWKNEIESEFGSGCRIIAAHSSSDWKNKLKHLVSAMKLGVGDEKRNFVVGTIQTLHKPKFVEYLLGISPEKIMLIADEVHHVGAAQYVKLLQIDGHYRLGLSATPERFWDDQGNQSIFEYFGPVSFEYDISKAIKSGFLTPYDYHITVAYLTENERKEFASLSLRITRELNKVCQAYPDMKRFGIPTLMQNLERLDYSAFAKLRTLYLARVDLFKAATNKQDALRELVRTHKLRRCLVYCNDLQHLNQCATLLHQEGFIADEYSSALPFDLRAKLLNSFADDYAETRFLLSVKCLDEGIDLPAVDSAILIASSRSTREFVQRRGRVLRKHPSKSTSSIYDIVVLPVNIEELRYALTEPERQFVEAEISRVALFASDARNLNDPELSILLKKFRPFVKNEMLNMQSS